MAGKKKATETPLVVTADLLANRLSIAPPTMPIYVIDPITGEDVPLLVSSMKKSIAHNATEDKPVRIILKNLPGAE